MTGQNTLLGHIFVLCRRLTVNFFKFGKPYCTSNICYVCCFCLTFFNQLSHLKIKNALFSKPIEMKKMHWGHLFMKLFKALTAHDLSLIYALALQHGSQNYFLLISCSTFHSYAQMCCKRYHIIFSTFSLKFKCKICVQREVIHNFKNHILVT